MYSETLTSPSDRPFLPRFITGTIQRYSRQTAAAWQMPLPDHGGRDETTASRMNQTRT